MKWQKHPFANGNLFCYFLLKNWLFEHLPAMVISYHLSKIKDRHCGILLKWEKCQIWIANSLPFEKNAISSFARIDEITKACINYVIVFWFVSHEKWDTKASGDVVNDWMIIATSTNGYHNNAMFLFFNLVYHL